MHPLRNLPPPPTRIYADVVLPGSGGGGCSRGAKSSPSGAEEQVDCPLRNFPSPPTRIYAGVILPGLGGEGCSGALRTGKTQDREQVCKLTWLPFDGADSTFCKKSVPQFADPVDQRKLASIKQALTMDKETGCQ